MNAAQIKPLVNTVFAWAAFLCALVAACKIFGIQFPIQIRGSATELAILAVALSLAKVP